MTAAVPRRWRDQRVTGLLLTAGLVVAGGAWLQHTPDLPAPTPSAVASATSDRALQDRFNAAVLLLQAGRHEQARVAFVRVIEQAPRSPEAHVNLGYALLGLQRAGPARQAFETAIALQPMQANAYHGLALAHEALGDLDLAIGAMRSYVHLAPHGDAAHVRRAQAALWEWEAQRAARRAAPFPDPGTDSRTRQTR